MKKIILVSFLSLFVLSVYSQDDDQDSQSKAYFGVSLGLAMPGGDIKDDEGLLTGLDLGFINFGYRFSETLGVTLNLVSSGHVADDYLDETTIGVGYFGIGPTYTASLGGNVSWDIKPQLALGMIGKVRGQGDFDDIDWKGSGFVIGNSIVFGTSKGIKASINLDYLSSKFTEAEYEGVSIEITEDNKFSKFVIGVGVRYNF